MSPDRKKPSKWWFWWAIIAVNAYALWRSLRYHDLWRWSGEGIWLRLLFWELAAFVVGLISYGAAHARCSQGTRSTNGGAKKPSTWWLWGPMIAVNAWVLLPRLIAGPSPYHGVGAPAWFGVLLLEVVALVLGLAFYAAAAIDARRSTRKRGDGSHG